jgi:hypothetical protein
VALFGGQQLVHDLRGQLKEPHEEALRDFYHEFIISASFGYYFFFTIKLN